MNKFEKENGLTSGVSEYRFGYNYTTQDMNDDHYPEFLESVKKRFEEIIAAGKKLFTTNATFLYETYLDGFPRLAQHIYKCRSCQQFIERFGHLAYITDTGKLRSALWDAANVPSFFKKSVQALQLSVENSHVTGVFQAEEMVLGTPKTGVWEHISVTVPHSYTNRSSIQTAYSWMAERKEEYRTLNNAISKFTFSTVEQGAHLIEHGNLQRVEKIRGMGKWFYELRLGLRNLKLPRNRTNFIWRAVASAPTGFCHIPSSAYGAFLEDIQEGLSVKTIVEKHNERTSPLVYQRPQAAPKAGNIARAEKIVSELKSAGALSRRFAREDEIKALWKPRTRVKEVRQGVFGHLYQDEREFDSSRPLPVSIMTWEKFARTVLPNALEIEYLVTAGLNSYSAILTATNHFAPPILQWDNEGQRNPFSWYVYGKGSTNYDWSLPTGYVKVNAVTLQPSMWYVENEHQGKAVHFILEGAKDKRYRGAGNALFPETLKSEYRQIRATIESYSKGEMIQGGHYGALANGIRLQEGHNWNAQFKVKTSTGSAVYKLDRWD